jgi:probable HAF family extracellular repeat protein
MKRADQRIRLSIAVIVASAVWITPTHAAMFQGLGFLEAGTASRANAISADGSVVVGYSTMSQGTEAFRWTLSGGMVGLGDLAGDAYYSAATAVSADGSVIVGKSKSSNSASPPPTNYYEAFLWTGGTMTGLGDLSGGAFNSQATAVSADGSVVAGYSAISSGSHAFSWYAGTMSDLGSLGGSSYATGISADGSVVVGYSGTTAQAFRWTGGVMTGLGTLSGSKSWANAVSADGTVVVGYSYSGLGTEPFRWTEATGMMVGLGFSGSATAVSGDGSVVVGSSTDGGWIWDSTHGKRNITDLLTSLGLDWTGWSGFSPTGISADGLTIVGYATYSGQQEAWIANLSPVPLPGAALLGILGLSFAGWRLRRHERQ